MKYYTFTFLDGVKGYAMAKSLHQVLESLEIGTIAPCSERECRLFTGYSNIPCYWYWFEDEDGGYSCLHLL